MIILITCAATLGLAIVDLFLSRFWGLPGITQYFALSKNGLSNLMLWQPITQLFIFPSYGMGVTFGLLLTLFFNCYIFWFLASMLVDHLGIKRFLGLFFFSGIATGLLAVSIASPLTQFAGLYAPLLAILFVWSMLYPDAELYLFFLFPIQARYIVGGLIGLFILTDISQGDLLGLLTSLFALFCGYLYGLVVLELPSPFPQTHGFDNRVLAFRDWLRHRKEQKEEARKFTSSSARIVDINTGEGIIDDDDMFVDTMLEKVSKYGEKSLTKAEKERLANISARKKDNQ
jgi:membrane associated rhomboid family serine protease